MSLGSVPPRAREMTPAEVAVFETFVVPRYLSLFGERLLDQLVEMLMHSNNVDEVFVEDYELRRRMREPLRRQVAEEEELAQEVRSRLKHVQEGTALWEVEYRRMMEDIKRRKGL